MTEWSNEDSSVDAMGSLDSGKEGPWRAVECYEAGRLLPLIGPSFLASLECQIDIDCGRLSRNRDTSELAVRSADFSTYTSRSSMGGYSVGERERCTCISEPKS